MLSGDFIESILADRGYSYLHHANTSATALSFLRNKALLSRQYVSVHPTTSYQTWQGTDSIDKKYGIFNDIFFDAENLWENVINNYGPVVFRYSLKVLQGKKIRISNGNPVKWEDIPAEKRYLVSEDDVIKLSPEGQSWPWGSHIIFPNTERLCFTQLEDVQFYIPTKEYNGDEQNNPAKARKAIEDACAAIGKPIVVKKFTGDFNNYGRFYGFISKVP